MNKVTADEMRAVPQSRVMSIDFLFDDFDRLIQSPESVHRLRRFILDLAVRGKLVPQDPNDEPASELLKRIVAEKARLVTAGEIGKQKPMARLKEAQQAFDLPSGWFPTKLGLVTVCLDYMRKPVNGTERKRRIAEKSQSQLFPYFGATQQQGWIDEYIFDEELVLLGEDGVPFFDSLRPKAYLIAGKSWVNNHAHVFRGVLVSNAYLVHYLNVFDYSGRVVGATRSKLNQAKALEIPVMLPPLAEQHRIVAKIDELMALCDRLEAARAEREATRDRLATASLARLNAPDPDPAMFQHDVAFSLKNLTPLTTRPDQIKALRQTILNLAVRGKLLEQEASEGSVDELLDELSIQQKRLINGKKLKRSVVTCNLEIQDNLASIPNSWRWVPLGKLISFGPQNGISPRATNSTDTPRAITLTATTSGIFDASHFKHVEADVPADSEYWLRDGDLLFQRGNTREYVGIAAYFSGASGIFLYPDLIIKVRLLNGLYLPYVHLALVSPGARTYFSTNATGAQETMPKINQQTLLNAPVPLPPLAEQHRIVGKVDELMALCDRLEASLVKDGKARGRLVEALLYNLLSDHKATAALLGAGISRNRGEND